jgi:hypothetical protein
MRELLRSRRLRLALTGICSSSGFLSIGSLITVPPYVWKVLRDEDYSSSLPLWASNDIEARIEHRDSYRQRRIERYYGVRFDPSGVQGLLPEQGLRLDRKVGTTTTSPPSSAEPSPPAKRPANKGGRPRKEFWDDLLIAIFKQIWDGDLQPQTQADIERAMLDWASDNGHQLSESSVKTPARKLFAATRSET